MRRNEEEKRSDIEECRAKIKATLAEYRCYLMSADEWHSVLLRDMDTDQTVGGINP